MSIHTMNALQTKAHWNITTQYASGPFNLTPENYPLRVVADPRFYAIIDRAVEQNQKISVTPQRRPSSVMSGWSSASRVSSIDLESLETDEGLKTAETGSKLRRWMIVVLVILGSLIAIGVILAIVLPLTLSNSSTTVSTGSTTPTTTV